LNIKNPQNANNLFAVSNVSWFIAKSNRVGMPKGSITFCTQLWRAACTYRVCDYILNIHRYLEARKKKHKKDKMEADLDFPGHEKIKFGEVVEAPPKLLSVPKVSS
jgi:hypothetical protein